MGRRLQLWQELKELLTLQEWSRWCIMGDFNAVLSSEERKGVASVVNLEGMSDF